MRKRKEDDQSITVALSIDEAVAKGAHVLLDLIDRATGWPGRIAGKSTSREIKG